MAEPDKRPVTMEELLVSSLAQTDALAKLLIEKGLITREEFMQKISEERPNVPKTSASTIGLFWSENDTATERAREKKRSLFR
jgi:hypothetical protein